jgi:hypothetical protein
MFLSVVKRLILSGFLDSRPGGRHNGPACGIGLWPDPLVCVSAALK